MLTGCGARDVCAAQGGVWAPAGGQFPPWRWTWGCGAGALGPVTPHHSPPEFLWQLLERGTAALFSCVSPSPLCFSEQIVCGLADFMFLCGNSPHTLGFPLCSRLRALSLPLVLHHVIALLLPESLVREKTTIHCRSDNSAICLVADILFLHLSVASRFPIISRLLLDYPRSLWPLR